MIKKVTAWVYVDIKNKEGVVVMTKFPKPPPISTQPRVYVRPPQCNCGDNDKCSHALWCEVNNV